MILRPFPRHNRFNLHFSKMISETGSIFLYDKSFDGFLTCIFQSYNRKILPQALLGTGEQLPGLWDRLVHIKTDETQAERVWNGLKGRITEPSADALFRLHFSEMEGVDLPLFYYIRKIFDIGPGITANFADIHVNKIEELQKRMDKEACRVAQFIRFQQTADKLYFAAYDPEFNVIPMVLHHFMDRFADQRWMIYDVRRKKGYYFDGIDIQWVTLVSDKIDERTGELDEEILDKDEILFQELWKGYFKSICIAERTNLKLHMQKVPRKYWKFLTEKKSPRDRISEKKTDLYPKI
jgi:probable DNA metabolism protein